MTKIKCEDGITRTRSQYNTWIYNLMQLYECEPGDLTEDEYRQLVLEGCIDE